MVQLAPRPGAASVPVSLSLRRCGRLHHDDAGTPVLRGLQLDARGAMNLVGAGPAVVQRSWPRARWLRAPQAEASSARARAWPPP